MLDGGLYTQFNCMDLCYRKISIAKLNVKRSHDGAARMSSLYVFYSKLVTTYLEKEKEAHLKFILTEKGINHYYKSKYSDKYMKNMKIGKIYIEKVEFSLNLKN